MKKLKGKIEEYLYNDQNIFVQKGAINKLYKGIRKSDSKKVLIKETMLSAYKDLSNKNSILNEGILDFRHENLVETYEQITLNNSIFIIREYVEGIDLKNFTSLKKYKKLRTVKFYLKCMISVLQGLDYLHNNQIIHCDIKPSNIIICEENGAINTKNPQVKLIDYGMIRSGKNKTINNKVSPFALVYASPEQLLNLHTEVNATSDLFSLGITLYELITGNPPIQSDNPLMLMTLQLTYPLKKHRKIPSELFNIIEKACYKYPFKRPPRMYKHEYVMKYIREAQSKRYQSAEELMNVLSVYLKIN